jgi:large subunit ribosomal protein L24
MNNKVHVKTGDTVIVISGKGKGKKGKIVDVSPAEGKVIVGGVNIVTKHVKPKKQGQEGGIVKAEGALYASKVQLFCTKCGKPTRIKKLVLENGTKSRICKHCGEEL